MHPLTPDLSKLSDQELNDKIRELSAKLGQSYRLGNGQLIGQISMILEDYQTELTRRQRLELEKLMANNQDKFKGIIDIS